MAAWGVENGVEKVGDTGDTGDGSLTSAVLTSSV